MIGLYFEKYDWSKFYKDNLIGLNLHKKYDWSIRFQFKIDNISLVDIF